MAVGVGGWCALSVSLSNFCKEDSQFAPDWYRWHALPTKLLIYYSETLLNCKLLQQKKNKCGPGWMFRLEFTSLQAVCVSCFPAKTILCRVNTFLFKRFWSSSVSLHCCIAARRHAFFSAPACHVGERPCAQTVPHPTIPSLHNESSRL